KQELTSRWDFIMVVGSRDVWECREKRATGALHFKTGFRDWSVNKVQAHIDKIGLWFGGQRSPPLIGGAMVMGLPHLVDFCRHGWQDVFGIRDILLQQRWDRQPLLGINAIWHCGASFCPKTHSHPEDLCPTGVWHCGCRQPPCPGHRSPI